jgi:hypothetical protein
MRPVASFASAKLLLLIAALFVIALLFAGIGYVSASPGADTPSVSATSVPADGSAFISGRVEAINAGSITLSTASGDVTIALRSDAPSERATAALIGDLRPGDWLNGTALPHEQTFFVLQGIVLIPESLLGEGP